MRVKGKSTVAGGRYRGTDKDGKSVYWSQDEATVDLSDASYWECKDDPSILIVDIDSPPERPKPAQTNALGQPAAQPASNQDGLNQAMLAFAQAILTHVGGPSTGAVSPQLQAAMAGNQGTGNPAAGSGATAASTVTIPDNGGTGPSVAPSGATPLSTKNK